MSVRRIAKLAGVSPSTVSLALKNSPKIQPRTRQLVAEIAKQIGYTPNAKVNELMSHVRLSSAPQVEACLAVISFYEEARPWESSLHLQRIYGSMYRRAESLGYRLEPMWVRAPGMTHHRFGSILDSRGIEGVLCLGSPDVDEMFPLEYDHFAVVTQGMSIKTPLHRVVTHTSSDMCRTLEMVHRLGYRRPGLIVGQCKEERRVHGHISACLGWSQQKYGDAGRVPILNSVRMEEALIGPWLESHDLDVIILVEKPELLTEFNLVLQRIGMRWPNDIGVAVITETLESTGFSGYQENQELIGVSAVELLVERIMYHDLGIPENPRTLMVESQWVTGSSLSLKLE